MKYTHWLLALMVPMSVSACDDAGGGANSQANSNQADAWQVLIEDTASTAGSDVTMSADTTTVIDSGAASQTDSAISEDTGAPPTGDAALADAGTPGPTDTPDATGPVGLPAGLTGQAPPQPQGMPSLAGVVDTTGSPVLEDQLKDHWSVLWFYPLASTSG